MITRQRLALAVAALVIAVGWFASAAIGSALSFSSPIPSGFVHLFLPETIPHYAVTDGGLMSVAAVLSAIACGALFIVFWMLLAASARTSARFGGAWLAAILASFATTLLWSIGSVIGNWPPMRLAMMFGDVQQNLLGAGYIGIIWGWLPALIVVLMLRRAEPHPAPAATRQRRAVRWIPAGVAAAAVLALLGVVPLAVAEPDPQVPVAQPEATPTTPPVVYGSPTVGPAFQDPDPSWCSSEQLQAGLGGGDAATGHRMQRVELTNTSAASCVLTGYPDLAFDDVDGWAMDILVVTGGSFMTTDAGAQPITLEPGMSAHADIGWNAQAAAGDTQAGTILVAPYAGTERTPLSFTLDIVAGGNVAVTAWQLPEE